MQKSSLKTKLAARSFLRLFLFMIAMLLSSLGYAHQPVRNVTVAPEELVLWEGLYPFEKEKTKHVTFLEIPMVKKEISDLLPGMEQRLIGQYEVSTPIAKEGAYIIANGCQPHACSNHYVAIFNGETGSGTFVFYDDQPDGPVFGQIPAGMRCYSQTGTLSEFPDSIKQLILNRGSRSGTFKWSLSNHSWINDIRCLSKNGAITKAELSLVNRKVRSISAGKEGFIGGGFREGGDENRIYVHGNIGGHPSIAVQFIMEGGNANYSYLLILDRTTKKISAPVRIGGRGFRHVAIYKIERDAVLACTSSYGSGDAMPEPSVKGEVRFELTPHGIVESISLVGLDEWPRGCTPVP